MFSAHVHFREPDRRWASYHEQAETHPWPQAWALAETDDAKVLYERLLASLTDPAEQSRFARQGAVVIARQG